MFFIAYMLIKDKCMCLQDEWKRKSLVLQDKCNIEIFLSPVLYTYDVAMFYLK